MKSCFFKNLPDAGPCDGRLVRCHLIRRQVLTRELNAGPAMLRDERGWVWGCGGVTGIGGHHGALDYGGVNRLRIPRDRLPQPFIEWADELGLGWWVEREYL